jgi:hypothetical protein
VGAAVSAPIRPALWTDRPEARALLAAAVANPPRKAAYRVRDLTDRHEVRYMGRIPSALRDVQGAHLDALIRLESRGLLSRAEVLRNWKLTPTIAIDRALDAAAGAPPEEPFSAFAEAAE